MTPKICNCVIPRQFSLLGRLELVVIVDWGCFTNQWEKMNEAPPSPAGGRPKHISQKKDFLLHGRKLGGWTNEGMGASAKQSSFMTLKCCSPNYCISVQLPQRRHNFLLLKWHQGEWRDQLENATACLPSQNHFSSKSSFINLQWC